MNLSSMMEEFAKEMPQVHLPLIDERDRYLVSKMRECEGKNVVAVVGAGHVPGMKRYYREEIDRTAGQAVHLFSEQRTAGFGKTLFVAFPHVEHISEGN